MPLWSYTSLRCYRKVPVRSVILNADSAIIKVIRNSYKTAVRNNRFLNTQSICDLIRVFFDAQDVFRVQYIDSKPDHEIGFCDPYVGYLITWVSEAELLASVMTYGFKPETVYSWIR